MKKPKKRVTKAQRQAGRFLELAGIARHEAEEHAGEHAGYLLGQCVGVEDCAGRLRVKSGELFAQGNDEHARLFRSLAADLMDRASTLRKSHNDYRKEHGL